MMRTPLDLVSAFHRALNGGDVETLLTLVAEDVEVGGPRGSARGKSVVAEWFGRANVRLEPIRSFQRDDSVIVEEAATWRGSDGAVIGTATVATLYTVRVGAIVEILRFDEAPTDV
jgi:hypothetical protein